MPDKKPVIVLSPIPCPRGNDLCVRPNDGGSIATVCSAFRRYFSCTLQFGVRLSFFVLCVTLLAYLVIATSADERSFSKASDQPPNGLSRLAKKSTVSSATKQNHLTQYGKLPLSFEAYAGAEKGARFVSRGHGFIFYLRENGAALALATPSSDQTDPDNKSALPHQVLHMTWVGGKKNARIIALDQLPGKVNYFIGNDPRKWNTGLPLYAKVRYENVYPGIDVVYHGDHGQLEYDFVIRPGYSPRIVETAFTGAKELILDDTGDLLIKIGAGQIRQKKPFAYQDIEGERREVEAAYRVSGNKVSFSLGDYDPTKPLVIDPQLIYSTFLGGSGTEQGLGIAIDNQGSAYITGSTLSIDFPLSAPYQSVKDAFEDAFVVKLNAAGNGLVYSTYVGGNGTDIANAIAVDSQGNAYIAGQTGSGSFPIAGAVFQTSKSGFLDGFVTKLNASGSALLYSTYIGGDNNENIFGIAVDATGRAYITGRTDSTRLNFIPLQRNGRPLYKSSDAAANWVSSSTDLTASVVNAVTIDPASASTIYTGTNVGVFKSTDAGAHWNLTGQTRPSTAPVATTSVVVDPSNSSIVYAGSTGGGVYKSTNGGPLYDQKNTGLFPVVNALAIDPLTPATLYAGTSSGIYKSTNGADSWVEIKNGISGTSPRVNEIAIDPSNPNTVYIGTNRGMFKTTNAGGLWTAINGGALSTPIPEITALVIDPVSPSTLYVGARFSTEALFKSTDGGTSWTGGSVGLTYIAAGQTLLPQINTLAINPLSPATLYAATQNAAIYKSTNSGANWSQSNTGLPNIITNAITVDPTNPAIIYTGTNIGNDAFIARLDPAGSGPEYLLNLGGDENDEARGLALDGNNNAYVVGITNSPNFPIQNAFQSVFGGLSDAFVTKVNASGTGFTYSTFLGGSSLDTARAVAVRSDRAYVVGQTFSANFPLINPIKSSLAQFDADAFVTGFNASGAALDFSTYLGGESTDQALAVAVDSTGAIYVTGSTQSLLFPVENAPQPGPAGSIDAFVTKFNSTGSAFVYSTYLGGFASDQGNGIAVDGVGNAYVVGNTSSTNFPTVSPFQPTLKGTDAFITKIGPAVDLAVTMTDTPDPVLLGNDLTYTIETKNMGELAASGITLTDTLPADATLVSATPSQGSCSGSTTITCNLGSLGSGATATVTIVIKPPAAVSINNSVTVSSFETDPNQSNNSANQTTQVVFVDLAVFKNSASTRVAAGSRVIYVITARNDQGATASNVTLVDNLPAETTFVSCSSSGVCGGTGNNRTVSFSSLAVGEMVTAVIVAQVNNPMAEGTVITNTVIASSSLPDSNGSNNSAATAVTVAATPTKLNGSGKLAFSSGRVFTANSDGASQPAAVPNIPNATAPAWSPDGTKIAYQYTKFVSSGTLRQIDVANADGTSIVKIADNVWDQNRKIAWSPSGATIAYVGKDGVIYLGNADGSGFVKLPNSPSFVNDLDWSPDGSKFLITKDNDIYVMDLDGIVLTKLTNSGTGPNGAFSYRRGRWSHDMSKILCERKINNDFYADVMVMNADGSGVSRMLNLGGTYSPSWSPDGVKLAFYHTSEVHVMNLDGSGDTKISTAETCCGLGTTDWQPLPSITPPTPPPPGPTVTISGRGDGFAVMQLSGTRSGLFGLDGNNDYTFVNLPAGGNYTVTPLSDLYTFNPTSRTYNNLAVNITDADFTIAGNLNYSVSGSLTDKNGAAIVGAEITLVGGFPDPQKTSTDANGRYSFNNLQHFRNYSVFPSLNASYNYLPNAWSFFFGGASNNTQVVDFRGYTSATVTISGRVTDAANPGAGISGADVRISNSGLTTTADSNGNFSFANLVPGRDYTVTVNNASLLCVPNQVLMTSVITNQNAYFVCYQPRQLRTISGRAVDSFGNNMSNMLVSLTGAANHNVITAADGSYMFSSVPEGFNYNVRPQRYGFAFAPSKVTILGLNGDSPGNDFVGTGYTGRGTPALFELESAVYTAAETDGSVTITVKRAGNANAATVNLDTINGTATGIDYIQASGTLNFGAGETVKTFKLFLNHDGLVENPETVLLALNNPVGGFLGPQTLATLTITDNDTGAATLQLLLDQSGPDVNQLAAVDSLLLTRDPFTVLNRAEWWNLGADLNTRVMIFAKNLQLNQGETAAAVEITLSNGNYSSTVVAEDLRQVTNTDFSQVTFRLPDNLPAGICVVSLKLHGQLSNSGTIHIVQ